MAKSVAEKNGIIAAVNILLHFAYYLGFGIVLGIVHHMTIQRYAFIFVIIGFVFFILGLSTFGLGSKNIQNSVYKNENNKNSPPLFLSGIVSMIGDLAVFVVLNVIGSVIP